MTKLEIVKEEVEVPDGVTTKISDGKLIVKGPKGQLERSFVHPKLDIKADKGTISISCSRPKRLEMGLVGTWRAHISNMIHGVTEGFQYRMRIIFSHFPIKTSVKGDELVVENFLGERFPRKARILGGVKAKISGDEITLEGANKESVGQTAANIEKATMVTKYDPRVFQDGIYLVSRGDN